MAAETKTQRRRETIAKGTKQGATLSAKASTKEAIREIREISKSPHIDTGANTGEDIQAREALAKSMAAQTYRAPDTTNAAEISQTLQDCRYVPLAFLMEDLRRAAKRHTKGFSKDERADIATDALLLIVRWTKQGSAAPIYLGARGALPLRREWFDADTRTVIREGKATRPAANARAQRAMRAAIIQAVRDRNTDAEHILTKEAQRLNADGKRQTRIVARETSSIDDGSETMRQTLARVALENAQAQAEYAQLIPDADAPELIADAMGISRDAARTILARGYRLSAEDCAKLWNVSHKRAENILSAGNREISKRFQTSLELLDALAAAAPNVRELLKTRAYQALRDVTNARYWEDADALRAIAAQAVNEYRAAVAELPMERRAIELAAARVGWQPETIGAYEHLTRLTRAETKRMTQRAAVAGMGSQLPGRSADASGDALNVSRVSRADRIWTYGLEARTDRAARSGDARTIERAPRSPRVWHKRGDTESVIGPTVWPKQQGAYGGACSVLYLYRGAPRRGNVD